MAKPSNLKIVGVKADTLAIFEGVLAGVIGLGVAIIHSLSATVHVAKETDSVLHGLAFGMAAGIVSVLLLPLIYFAFGWVVGYLHGWIFNMVAGASGGIVLKTED